MLEIVNVALAIVAVAVCPADKEQLETRPVPFVSETVCAVAVLDPASALENVAVPVTTNVCELTNPLVIVNVGAAVVVLS